MICWGYLLMNLANKITIVRICMIPIFLVALLNNFLDPSLSRIFATVIFILASATDALDGHIARSQNMITDFGKFMDPIADKLLVSSALIGLVQLDELSAIVVIIIISREFIISGFRLVAASKNIVIAASIWGKFKTIVQMVMIVVVLSGINKLHPILETISQILIWVSAILSIISAVDYIMKNIDVLKEEK